MREFHFRLDIYYTTFLRHYSGQAATIMVEAEENGQRIQFPAFHLRPFVTHIGIRGRFKITLGRNNSIVSLKQVG
ncbi:MAG: DUF2835 family protein [Vibrionaceae bacterium]